MPHVSRSQSRHAGGSREVHNSQLSPYSAYTNGSRSSGEDHHTPAVNPSTHHYYASSNDYGHAPYASSAQPSYGYGQPSAQNHQSAASRPWGHENPEVLRVVHDPALNRLYYPQSRKSHNPHGHNNVAQRREPPRPSHPNGSYGQSPGAQQQPAGQNNYPRQQTLAAGLQQGDNMMTAWEREDQRAGAWHGYVSR